MTCAYLASVTSTAVVERWVDGSETTDSGTRQRVRTALEVAAPIAAADSAAVARAWFIGMNPELDDRSALALLREGDHAEVGPEVIGAARAFLAS